MLTSPQFTTELPDWKGITENNGSNMACIFDCDI